MDAVDIVFLSNIERARKKGEKKPEVRGVRVGKAAFVGRHG
jgi:hypothetical protein